MDGAVGAPPVGEWEVNASLFDAYRALPADERPYWEGRRELQARAMRDAATDGRGGYLGTYQLRPAAGPTSLDTGATSPHFSPGVERAAWRKARLATAPDPGREGREARDEQKRAMADTLRAAADTGSWGMLIGRSPSTGMGISAGDWLRDRARALGGCRGALGFRDAGCGWTLARPLSCRVRGCPDCERARAARVVGAYAGAAARMAHPALVTVTIRNVPATYAALDGALDQLREGWAHLGRRAVFRGGRCKSWRSRHAAAWRARGNARPWPGHFPVVGGLSSVEVTYNADADTFHAHLHALVDVRWLDQAELSDEWRALTGSYVVDIRRIRGGPDGMRAALTEVLKYVAKPSPHLVDPERPDRLAAVLVALRGRRLIAGFGSMFGVQVDPDEDPEPEPAVRVQDPHDPYRSYLLPARCPYCGEDALWEAPVQLDRVDCRRPPAIRPGQPPPPLAWIPPPARPS